MHILQLTKKIPYPMHDGEAIAIMNLLRGFYNHGHKVTVLSMNTPKHHFDLAALPQKIRKMADFTSVDVDTQPRLMKATQSFVKGGSYNIERFISEQYREKLKELLEEHDFDLVQLEGLYLAPYLDVIRKYNIPVVLRSHNLEFEIWERLSFETDNFIKKKLYRTIAGRLKQFEVKMVNAYDAIAVISPDDGMKYKKLGCKVPMHITPAGVDTQKLQPANIKPGPPSLFFIGSLDWKPNQEGLKWFLNKAWPELRKKYPDLDLHIAGRNMPPHWKKYEGSGVHITGEVDNAVNFMRSGTIMIVPLFSGSGMRVKIIEAMALGKTVISTSLGAEGIFCENEKDILIENEAKGFINRLSEVINSKELCARIGSKASELVKEKYDYNQIAEGLLKFYEKKVI